MRDGGVADDDTRLVTMPRGLRFTAGNLRMHKGEQAVRFEVAGPQMSRDKQGMGSIGPASQVAERQPIGEVRAGKIVFETDRHQAKFGGRRVVPAQQAALREGELHAGLLRVGRGGGLEMLLRLGEIAEGEQGRAPVERRAEGGSAEEEREQGGLERQ